MKNFVLVKSIPYHLGVLNIYGTITAADANAAALQIGSRVTEVDTSVEPPRFYLQEDAVLVQWFLQEVPPLTARPLDMK